MYSPTTKIIDIGKRPIDDYVFEAIISFQEGVDNIILKGRGDFISRAIDVYWALKDRLGNSIELVDIEIGSERVRGRMRSYIALKIMRKY
ncbi:DNA/RNA-binding protein albA [compost metagenome]